jgi:hypothetical protein
MQHQFYPIIEIEDVIAMFTIECLCSGGAADWSGHFKTKVHLLL